MKMNPLIPAIIQSAQNGRVLMLGYMNKAALQKTMSTKKVWFFSRSKKRLWMKGETSGNTLRFQSLAYDCDRDALLIQATPKGPTCHTGSASCFGKKIFLSELADLYETIRDRKNGMPKKSYTASLFRGGLKKICEKVAEESEEVIRAAKKESKKRVIEEGADVLYHLFVLLAQRRVEFAELEEELRRRKRPEPR